MKRKENVHFFKFCVFPLLVLKGIDHSLDNILCFFVIFSFFCQGAKTHLEEEDNRIRWSFLRASCSDPGFVPRWRGRPDAGVSLARGRLGGSLAEGQGKSQGPREVGNSEGSFWFLVLLHPGKKHPLGIDAI